MASKEHFALLKQGVVGWNQWRREYPNMSPDLRYANLNKAKLSEANLAKTDLTGANLAGAHLGSANLSQAGLAQADLSGADLSRANLSGAYPLYADLSRANLSFADLTKANLRSAILFEANLTEANLTEADLSSTDLSKATLYDADLTRAKLSGAKLIGAALTGALLGFANLRGADLSTANLGSANLTGANLTGATLIRTNLLKANLSGADLSYATLTGANLTIANLTMADLSYANLETSVLVETDLTGAILTRCSIYGISTWNVILRGTIQHSLVITPSNEPIITIDNLRIAQFVYLLLNNQEIRDVINTIGQKGVLILGRFSAERKPILDSLREKLRTLNFLPIVFDFERPAERDFTETIMTLAGLCSFIIADITNPKSSPLELQATVPDYMIPFVPLIQKGEQPFSMFKDLKNKYDWVLDPLAYDTPSNLIKVLEIAVVKPALEKRAKLLARKVEQLQVRDIDDFISKMPE